VEEKGPWPVTTLICSHVVSLGGWGEFVLTEFIYCGLFGDSCVFFVSWRLFCCVELRFSLDILQK
jgi:hypothetical protein